MKTVLVLAPHTDDGELGCGGSIHRFVQDDVEVRYIAFSYLPDFQNGILREEATNASIDLGTFIDFKQYTVRRFQDFRQEILDDMIGLNREWLPDLVFVPSLQDIHQDHQVITTEAMRAFKHTSILGYELPCGNYKCEVNYYIQLSEKDIDKKIQALTCYESQRHRPYMDTNFIRSLALLRGMQAGMQWAEAFSVIRWVMR